MSAPPVFKPPVSKPDSSSRPSVISSGKSLLHKGVSVLKKPALLASVAVTALLLGVRHMGLLQPLELAAFDQSLRQRPALKEDPRLLVVTITEEDLHNWQWPVPDAVMHQALEKLEQYQPEVIGLDNYRDMPVGSAHQEFATHMRSGDRIIPVCKAKEGDTPEVPPPPYLEDESVQKQRVGFSDILVDRDGIVRRGLFFLDPAPNARCKTPSSFSFQLARLYLEKKGIKPELTKQKYVQLGKVVFKRLDTTAGGYENLGAGGYQIFLNYRSPNHLAQEVTLTQVLNGSVKPEWVKDRIVLIGSTAPSLKDYFFTPYSAGQQSNQKMPGVVVHAQMVSQILSAVLDGRPLFWYWSDTEEALWIWGWSLTGGLLAWRLRNRIRILILAGGVSFCVLLGTSWILFTQSGWVPVVPPALALLLTGGSVMAYSAYQTQQEQKLIIQQAKEQEDTIKQLKELLKDTSVATVQPLKAPSEDDTEGPTAFAPSDEMEETTFAPSDEMEETEFAPPSDEMGETAFAPSDEMEETAFAPPSEEMEETEFAPPQEESEEETAVAPTRKESLEETAVAPKKAGGKTQQKKSSSRPTSLLKNRYKIMRVLGAGGFGLTYLAEDTDRPGNPKCVVKHLRPARRDEKFLKLARRLFSTEAEILEKLGNHTQIPQLLAYFEERQEFYLVQELIEGHPLSDELPVDKRLPEAQVVEVLRGVLEILDFIHNHCVIHRDIKPSNIIRREQDKSLVLIDFGAVKEIQPQEPTEQEGLTVAIGTRGYTPPEQLAGHPRLTSDIYALGMIGIQALTGIHPHQMHQNAITGEISWRHLASVEEDFAQILEKMVRYHFIERYQSAGEVLQDLKRLPERTKQEIKAEV